MEKSNHYFFKAVVSFALLGILDILSSLAIDYYQLPNTSPVIEWVSMIARILLIFLPLFYVSIGFIELYENRNQ